MSTGKTIKFSGKGQGGNLLDPKNWVGGVVPGINDTALITTNIGGPATGVFSVNNTMLLGNEAITFTGTLNTAGVGACKGLMVCDGASAIFAPGAVLNDGNVLIVGNEAAGTLIAQGSGSTHSVLNSVSANLGKAAAGVGTVNIDDGVWINSGHAFIGDAGKATLNVLDNGAVTFGGDVDMAAHAGASGIMTIAGGGSVVVDGALRIGGQTAIPTATPGAATAIANSPTATVRGVASVTVGTGSSLTVDKTLLVGTGSELDLAGGAVTAGSAAGCIATLAGGVISGYGTLGSVGKEAIEDQGTIRASGGTLRVDGDIGGKGAVQIDANSTANLTGARLNLASIAFVGSDAKLALAHGSSVAATISGFGIGDIIAMAKIDAVSFNAATGRLSISENNALVETLHFAGSFAGEAFSVTQTGAGGLISLHHTPGV